MSLPARVALLTSLTALAVLLAATPALAGTPQTLTYPEPGTYSWTVPPNVEHVEVTVVGAAGGSAASGACRPGAGGRVVATIPVAPGEQLTIDVGGAGGNGSGGTGGAGGSNGGGPGGSPGSGTPIGGGGGGGWTGVSTTAGPLLVAGGGGGCGAGASAATTGNGGADEAAGEAGSSPGAAATPGGGGAGTQSGGGAGGIADDGFDPADEGTSFQGGTGFAAQTDSGGGGGGGGGYFGGGGGGGFQPLHGQVAGGGGGGSNFAAPVAGAVTVTHAVNPDDDGSAAITYVQPGTTVGETPRGGGSALGLAPADSGAWLQLATPGGGYVVPADGVITSWTYASRVHEGTTGLRLLVGRGSPPSTSFPEPLNAPPGSFAVIARSPAAPAPAISQPAWQVTGYPARIPVRAGDLIGTEWSAGMAARKINDNFADLALPGDLSADGGTLTIPYRTKMEEVVEHDGFGPGGATAYPGLRLPISVQVEPDADADGWGDLTQDRCPGYPGSREGCPVADLGISETVAAASPWPRATFTQVVSNAGPDPVTDAAVTEALPAGAAPVSASTSAGSCTLAATVVCRPGPLAPGASATITLVVQAGSPGPLSVTATVASQALATAAADLPGAGDQDPGNDTATAGTVVEAPPAGGPAPSSGGGSRTAAAPEITHLRQSAGRWREGRKVAKAAKGRRPKVPTGTTFRFALNEPASVTMTFTRRVPRRNPQRHCAASRARRDRPACMSTQTLGALRLDGKAGTNAIPFVGRLAGGRRLPPGRISVTFYARDAAGRRAAPRSLTFTIVK